MLAKNEIEKHSKPKKVLEKPKKFQSKKPSESNNKLDKKFK